MHAAAEGLSRPCLCGRLQNTAQADMGPFPVDRPFKNSYTFLKRNPAQVGGKGGGAGSCSPRLSPEQLDQPLLQVLLGSIQVVQVREHLLVVLLPARHLLAESIVILLDFCRGFFKFLLGPGGGVGSLLWKPEPTSGFPQASGDVTQACNEGPSYPLSLFPSQRGRPLALPTGRLCNPLAFKPPLAHPDSSHTSPCNKYNGPSGRAGDLRLLGAPQAS